VRETDTPANITSNAAERVQMSADTSAMVASTVKPAIHAGAANEGAGLGDSSGLIGRRSHSESARGEWPAHPGFRRPDAVRQWHFKPHVEGAEAVETQAKITVNFTISTN